MSSSCLRWIESRTSTVPENRRAAEHAIPAVIRSGLAFVMHRKDMCAAVPCDLLERSERLEHVAVRAGIADRLEPEQSVEDHEHRLESRHGLAEQFRSVARARGESTHAAAHRAVCPLRHEVPPDLGDLFLESDVDDRSGCRTAFKPSLAAGYRVRRGGRAAVDFPAFGLPDSTENPPAGRMPSTSTPSHRPGGRSDRRW